MAKNTRHSKRRPVNILFGERSVLPSLLTTGSLFISFYGMIAAIGGDFRMAAISIIIAAFLDAFDGRVARFTNSSTSFGGHYDSLVDVISFGIAPALVVYLYYLANWRELSQNTISLPIDETYLYYLDQPDAIAMSLAFAYMACCCVRLARFSTNEDEGDEDFNGMPSPTAGGFVAACVWNLEIYPGWGNVGIYVLGGIVLITGILMVVNIPFISGRKFGIVSNRKISIRTILAIFYLAILAVRPAEGLFISGCLYITFAVVTKIRISRAGSNKGSSAGSSLRSKNKPN